MKTYGNGMKATEFTKKQISVIYRMAKNNELKVERWVMSDLYDLADFYSYDDNGNVAKLEERITKILDAVFGKDLETAQALINEYTEDRFNLMGRRFQESANRQLVA